MWWHTVLNPLSDLSRGQNEIHQHKSIHEFWNWNSESCILIFGEWMHTIATLTDTPLHSDFSKWYFHSYRLLQYRHPIAPIGSLTYCELFWITLLHWKRLPINTKSKRNMWKDTPFRIQEGVTDNCFSKGHTIWFTKIITFESLKYTLNKALIIYPLSSALIILPVNIQYLLHIK